MSCHAVLMKFVIEPLIPVFFRATMDPGQTIGIVMGLGQSAAAAQAKASFFSRKDSWMI